MFNWPDLAAGRAAEEQQKPQRAVCAGITLGQRMTA